VTALSHQVAWFGRACSGHSLSGDAAIVMEQGGHVRLAIVDALGHGPAAHEVARKAAESLRDSAEAELPDAMRRLHEALRGTLGAAAGICRVDVDTGEARWLAVGNVVLRTFGEVETRLPGADGLIGHVLPRLREQAIRLRPGDLLLLVTDGVKDRMSAEGYPGLLGDSPALLARRVIERFGRDHDDATCIALRIVR
jgi:negative regulator of sigma-B (phosphoserine phosphatase)